MSEEIILKVREDKANKSLYSVQLAGMSVGVYNFDFAIDKALLVKYGNEEVLDVEAKALITLTLRPNVAQVSIKLQGVLEIVCDRCLAPYFYSFKLEEIAILKQISKDTNVELNIIIFDAEKGIVVFDQYIYDMLITALPIQRVHSNEKECDQDMIKRIKTENKIEKRVDPRWNELQNLI